MKFLTFAFLLIILFASCESSKFLAKNKTHTWENKLVTEKAYNRKLYRFTHKFVKNSSMEDLKLFSELEVVYDTIPPKK
jgi:hypothetical protein